MRNRLRITLLFMLFSPMVLAGNVTFVNKTGGTLSCTKQVDNDFLAFLELEDNETKHFSNFSLPTQVRCSADLSKKSARSSSTLLTHFNADAEGEYTALLQFIECDDGCGQGWRTIIVMPSGEPHFTRYKHLEKGAGGKSPAGRLKGGGTAQIRWEEAPTRDSSH
ncbi:MAG: hypothetical protein CME59_16245 [Halioglobus sp.]|nr:hypothetical protein [Halioglobus sp.]|tara:strand:- start:7346 stop:7840 length:495 start_codon:yes stop_codon:yes gene_type:complete